VQQLQDIMTCLYVACGAYAGDTRADDAYFDVGREGGGVEEGAAARGLGTERFGGSDGGGASGNDGADGGRAEFSQ
jgi:hypothetical protein